MPEALSQTLALPGVWSLILAMSVAGIVRGFSGFGTALIFVPVAGLFLSPAQVVGTIVITGILALPLSHLTIMTVILPSASAFSSAGPVSTSWTSTTFSQPAARAMPASEVFLPV